MDGGEIKIENDWEELASGTDDPKTIVLVGRTGNGKSATGNSILRRKCFRSSHSSSGVTNTSELQTTVLADGQVVNVIDTPGIFDSSEGNEDLRKEIVKCIGLAKNGIHAFLLVFSIRTRFSLQEEAALQYMRDFFGEKIIDYMIVAFTGGDELIDDEVTLDEYLGSKCPQSLQDVIKLCGNRVILFDNKTKDETQRADQVEKLMSLVNSLIACNDGLPYTNELFQEMKKGVSMNSGDIKKQNDHLDEHINGITEMVEKKLKETTLRLEKDLETERAARVEAEKKAAEATKKLANESRKKQEKMETAHKAATLRLERDLKTEQAARANAEKKSADVKQKLEAAKAARAKAKQKTAREKADESRKVLSPLEAAHRLAAEVHARAVNVQNCAIM